MLNEINWQGLDAGLFLAALIEVGRVRDEEDWALVDWALVDWALVDWALVDWALVDWALVD